MRRLGCFSKEIMKNDSISRKSSRQPMTSWSPKDRRVESNPEVCKSQWCQNHTLYAGLSVWFHEKRWNFFSCKLHLKTPLEETVF